MDLGTWDGSPGEVGSEEAERQGSSVADRRAMPVRDRTALSEPPEFARDSETPVKMPGVISERLLRLQWLQGWV